MQSPMSKMMELVFDLFGKDLIRVLTAFVSCKYKEAKMRAAAITIKNSAYPNVSGGTEISANLFKVEGRSLGGAGHLVVEPIPDDKS